MVGDGCDGGVLLTGLNPVGEVLMFAVKDRAVYLLILWRLSRMR
jgi:hypothetical protein